MNTKKAILLILLIVSLLFSFSLVSADDSLEITDEDFVVEEDKDSDSYITIDGRSYKKSPDFVMPSNISLDSPVQIHFTDETHEIISIEKLKDDTAVNDVLEYHYGIVNAITKANTDLNYRVYIEGIGYLFTKDTRIDETIAFLDKYASVVAITYQGKVIMCKVFASNLEIPEENIFWGPVENSKQTEDGYVLTVKGVKHNITPATETMGVITDENAWVFGYDIGDHANFVSVITEEFPVAAESTPFSGFVSLVGDMQKNHVFYISVGEGAYQISEETAYNDDLKIGDFVIGSQLNNKALVIEKVDLNYNKESYAVFNQVIDDAVYVKDQNAPDGKTLVSIALGETIIEIDSSTKVYGTLDIGVPVMCVTEFGKPRSIYALDAIDPNLVPVSGFISQIHKISTGYEFLMNGKTYTTDFDTKIDNSRPIALGSVIVGIADKSNVLKMMACFESVIPDATKYYYYGEITKLGSNGIQVGDQVIQTNADTVVSGNLKIGNQVSLVITNGIAELVYVFPSSLEDFTYHVSSGVLNGLREANKRGNRNINLDEDTFLVTPDTQLSRNLEYDEIGTALIKGLNTVSIIDVLLKPENQMSTFSGKIDKAEIGETKDNARFAIGANIYKVLPITPFLKFTDITRIRRGAKVTGIAYGDQVLVIMLVRGAGLFGILNPPWLEYALVGILLFLIFIVIFVNIRVNRTYWRTGYMDIGANDKIIFHDEYGDIHNYFVAPGLYEHLIKFKDEEVTVKIHKNTIMELK